MRQLQKWQSETFSDIVFTAIHNNDNSMLVEIATMVWETIGNNSVLPLKTEEKERFIKLLTGDLLYLNRLCRDTVGIINDIFMRFRSFVQIDEANRYREKYGLPADVNNLFIHLFGSVEFNMVVVEMVNKVIKSYWPLGAPEWMKDSVFEIHNAVDKLANDFVSRLLMKNEL